MQLLNSEPEAQGTLGMLPVNSSRSLLPEISSYTYTRVQKTKPQITSETRSCITTQVRETPLRVKRSDDSTPKIHLEHGLGRPFQEVHQPCDREPQLHQIIETSYPRAVRPEIEAALHH